MELAKERLQARIPTRRPMETVPIKLRGAVPTPLGLAVHEKGHASSKQTRVLHWGYVQSSRRTETWAQSSAVDMSTFPRATQEVRRRQT